MKDVTKLTALLLLFSHLLFAQQLVKDINTEPGSIILQESTTSQRCFTCGNFVYFVAKDAMGSELWKTDGTEAGTVRVKDINTGRGDGVFTYEELLCKDGLLYFRATDANGVLTIWKTDGTAAGTLPLTLPTIPGQLLVHNDKIVFTNAYSSDELWIFDAGNPTKIKTFTQMADASGSIRTLISSPFGLVAMVVYNSTTSPSIVRAELWKSDGTVAGTVQLKSWNDPAYFPSGIQAFGNQITFSIRPLINADPDIWVSDGTSEGTKKIASIPTSTTSDILFIGSFGNKAIFTRGSTAWVTDGTNAGTKILMQDNFVFNGGTFNGAYYMCTLKSPNYFLYKWDGTDSAPVQMNALGTSVRTSERLELVGGKLIVPYQTSDVGQELATTAGGLNDITLIKDINPGSARSNPRCFAKLGNDIIFMADDGMHGYELWRTDGTTAGTTLIKDVVTQSQSANIDKIFKVNGQLLFAAGSSPLFRPLWRSDGTEQGTVKVMEGDVSIFGQVKDRLIMFYGGAIVKTDGTQAGTVKLFNPPSGSSWQWTPGVPAADNLFFNFGTDGNVPELWRANITTNQIGLVKDIYPGYLSGVSRYIGAAAGEKLIFPAKGDDTTGEEVWVSDGTGSGTFLLKDINPTGDSFSNYFVSIGSQVLFKAFEPASGGELWVTDGTVAGTKLLKDIRPGDQTGLGPELPARLGDKVIFSGDDNGAGQELWISDGTSEGTKLLKDLNVTNFSSPSLFTSVGKEKVYFVADDGVHGRELFVTDGTASGTMVIDVVPGPVGSNPARLTAVKGAIYFYSNGKLYRSQGTASTTELVATFTLESDLYPVGNYLCFIAEDSEKGYELHRIEITKYPQEILEPNVEQVVAGSSVTIQSTSGLPVSMTLVSASDKVQIDGNKVNLIKPGPVTLDVTQEGNTDYLAANKKTLTLCVKPKVPVITADLSNPAEAVLKTDAVGVHEWLKGEKILSETGPVLTTKLSGVYKVGVTVEGCKSAYSAELDLLITGVEESFSTAAVYPNPASTTVNASLSTPADLVRYEIIDVNGRIVYSKIGRSLEILDVQSLGRGKYILRVTANGKTITKSFLKD